MEEPLSTIRNLSKVGRWISYIWEEENITADIEKFQGGDG